MNVICNHFMFCECKTCRHHSPHHFEKKSKLNVNCSSARCGYPFGAGTITVVKCTKLDKLEKEDEVPIPKQTNINKQEPRPV